MLEKLVQLDRKVFLWLNGMGVEAWDSTWEKITQFYWWIPVFALVLYIAYKKLGTKHFLLVLGMVALTILLTDQTTNLIKYLVARPRPCNEPDLKDIVHLAQGKGRKSFSFVSGHAANSMAVSFVVYNILKSRVKYIGLFFFWPLIFGYSRIYLGLHYPGDILCGYLYGLLTGWIILQLYKFIRQKYNPTFQ